MHSGDCSLFEVRPASGLLGNDLATYSIASISACCDACNTDPTCTSFTYYRGGCYTKYGKIANWGTLDGNWPNEYPADLSSGFLKALAPSSQLPLPPGKKSLSLIW